MNYMLLFTIPQENFDLSKDPAKAKPIYEAWQAYREALDAAGVVVGTGPRMGLPQTATTVRVRDGKRVVQDGPYAETKEMLAGWMIIDTPDLDGALEWAARCPAAGYAAVEVRPLMTTPY